MKFLLPLLFTALLAPAQTATPQGVTAEWDISQLLQALASQAKQLKPILDQLNPQEWVTRGAPEAYVSQWRYAQSELIYLTDSAKALEKQPERLTLALDTLFRVQSLESRLNSLVDGVRNYQNPAVGDLLVGVLGENSTNRDRLRQYVTDLAATREQEFKIADNEAQRCRGMLGKQAPPKPVAPVRKKSN